MQNETTQSGILGELQRFETSTASAIDAIPHLQPTRVRFGAAVDVAADLLKRQAAAIADKQELSGQIPPALKDAQRLATILRKGLQQHFGPDADRLAEFGIKPLRGRQRPAPAPDPGDPTPPPPPATE
jgi:hypothetical protein